MKWIFFIFIGCLTLAAHAAENNSVVSLFPNGKPYGYVGETLAEYPAINYGTGQQAESIKRGEYLVKLGDCIGCHTEKNGKPFAGGLGSATPFGIIYSPNITPDMKTGIGAWTNQQFIKTVREGIAPHHKYLYPAFPYYYYNRIKDQDLLDIRAYLNAIPAVEKPNKKNQMIFPFGWRFLQIGWRMLFFDFHKKGPFKEDPGHNSEWNRGAYLVNVLGHCDMCHTPMYYVISRNIALGAPIVKYHLSGSFISGFYAPNITRLFINTISVKQFSDIFLKGVQPEGGPIEGPMKEVVSDSLQYATASDIKSMYSYLQTVPSGFPAKPAKGNQPASPEKIYLQYCKQCHNQGKGIIPGAPKVGDQEAWQTLNRAGMNQLLWFTLNGLAGMPIKGTCMDCTREELKNTIQYMMDQSIPPEKRGLQYAPKHPDGQKIYQQYCAACHSSATASAPLLGNQTVWNDLAKKGLDQLTLNTWHGTKGMPPKGGCANCNLAEVKAAVSYLLDQSVPNKDYQLW
ncbi:MAG: cytochrome c5 family protein [Proteobacteria bacterium]|nr:cytochrome c5 family protein [Pseudomonadota bacterium]